MKHSNRAVKRADGKTRKRTHEPPFEAAAVQNIDTETKRFRNKIFHALNLEERRQWMSCQSLNDFRIFSCGYFEKAAGHNRRRTCLDEAIVIYCVDGQGTYTQDDRTWTVKAGDLLYCPPRSSHQYTSDAQDDWTIYWMHLSGAKACYFRDLMGFSDATPIRPCGVMPRLTERFNELFSLFRPFHQKRDFLRLQCCAQQILSLAMELLETTHSRSVYDDRLRATLRLMDEHAGATADLAFFSRNFGASLEHFSRIFRQSYSISPMEYFSRIKNSKACRMLSGSNLSIKTIAASLGYDDPLYFSRVFRKHTGQSPSQYRKMTCR